VIVGIAVYRNGVESPIPRTSLEMAAACRDGGGIAWIGLYRPTHPASNIQRRSNETRRFSGGDDPFPEVS
jgi:hypothetical protein